MEQKDESVVVRVLRNRPPMQRIGLLAEMGRKGIGADLKARYDLMNAAIERGEIAVDGEGRVKVVEQGDVGALHHRDFVPDDE